MNATSLPRVWVNILCTNERRFLSRCISAIKAQTYPAVVITVIDNASSDGSAEFVAREFPEVRLLRNAQNLFYCEAHNRGLVGIDGGFLLPLNADVFLLPDFIAELAAALQNHPPAGQAQGKLYQIAADEEFPPQRTERHIDTTGILLTRSRRNFDRGQEEPDIGQYDFPEEIFGADGSAPLYRWGFVEDILEDGALFDRSFGIYREVVDVSWRGRRRGWEALYVPSAAGFHVRGFSPRTRQRQSPRFRRFSYRNRYVTLLKNEDGEGLRRDWASFVAFEAAMAGYTLLREPHLMATWFEVLRRLPVILKQRRTIRARAKIGNGTLQRFFA